MPYNIDVYVGKDDSCMEKEDNLISMKHLVTAISAVSLVLSLTACNSSVPAQSAAHPQAKTVSPISSQQLMSDLWFQTSGEAKALYYQGYNIGTMRLDQALAKGTKQKPAVILDLDETVLDNSPYQAFTVKANKEYPYKWDEWIARAEAKALPGAIDFLKHADKKGVDIYYISNRKESQKEATIKNLQRIGAPQATSEHVLLKQPGEKGKEKRRQQVAKNHEILLFFGDNLADFSGFEGKSLVERNQTVEKMKSQFGDKLIIFPNPMYGDWEGAIYDFDYNKSNDEKNQLRRQHLNDFQP
jgi:5'-nucleotidase (lipoprotein e(P4) family)